MNTTMDSAPQALTPSQEVDSDSRLWAFAAHAGVLVSWLLAPLLVYVLQKGKSQYVEYQALQALLWSALCTILAVPTLGLSLVVGFIFHALAALRALSGETYEYPLVAKKARELMSAPSAAARAA